MYEAISMRSASRAWRTLATSALLTTALAGTAHADWTRDILDQRCAPETLDTMSEDMRDSIEGSVRRAETSILPPSPLGDLSCLNDLMTAPLDTFSNIGGLLGSLGNMGSGLAGLDLDIDVAGAVCGLAAEKWATLTTGLDANPLSLNQLSQLASKPADRIASGNTAKLPALLGTSRTTDSKGQAGSIDNYVRPNTGVSEGTASQPIYPDYQEEPWDQEAAAKAEHDAEMARLKALGSYIGCYVGKAVKGSGGGYDYDRGVYIPPSGDCVFNAPYVPPSSYGLSSTASAMPQSAPAPSAPVERTGGQARRTEPVVAPAPTTGNPIWDSLGK